MKNNNIAKKVFISLFFLMFSITGVFGVQDFSVSKNSLTFQTQHSQGGSDTFTITNTGNESINLTLTPPNLQGGSFTLSSNLNSTNIQNLENGSSSQITFSYNAPTNVAHYTGTILISNTNNPTQDKSISVSIDVNSQEYNSQLILVDSFNTNTVLSNLSFLIEDKGDTERIDFKIKNVGSSNYSNVKARVVVVDDDEFEDDDFEIEDNRYSSLNIDDLNINTLSKDLEFEYNSQSDIKAGNYQARLELYSNSQSSTILLSIPIYVSVTARSEDTEISRTGEDVVAGVLTYTLDPGQAETLDLEIKNLGVDDVRGFSLEVKEDLKEESSTKIFLKSNIEFSSSSSLDVNGEDDRRIRVKVSVPDEQEIGSYFGEIRLLDQEGDEISSIELKIRVIDDIYIDKILLNEKLSGNIEVKPGTELKVEIEIENDGATRIEDVQVFGEINNIAGTSDLKENTNSFVLSGNKNVKQTLYFEIPKNAKDNLYEVEIRLEYDSNILVERKNFRVVRDEHKVIFNSFGLSSRLAQCRDTIDSFITIENIGKRDEDIIYTANIKNTSISDSVTFLLEESEERSRAIKLDISNLKQGDYTVEQKIVYGTLTKKEDISLKVLNCSSQDKTGVEIRKIGGNTTGNRTENQSSLEKLGANSTTFALGIGLVFLIFLLIIGTFFL